MSPRRYPQTRSKTKEDLIEKTSNTRTITPPTNPKTAKSRKQKQPKNHSQTSNVAPTAAAAKVVDCSHETTQNNKNKATRKSLGKIFDINNSTDESEQQLESKVKLMLSELCVGDQSKKETQQIGYTQDDLMSFLANSTFKSVDLVAHSTAQLFQRFVDDIFEIEELTLTELIEYYHLGILMQSYNLLETDCMGYRSELLNAVAKLYIALPPDGIDFIGSVLCDRFVIGTGMKRMYKVVQMQDALSMLIINDDFSRQIAMSILLSTFVKVSGIQRINSNTDIISEVFEMVKLIDWMQMIIAGNVADVFILVRSFSLIINTHQNRIAHADWSKGTSSKIQQYFFRVLYTLRCSPNYGFFEMMVQSYICEAYKCGSPTIAMDTSTSMEMEVFIK